MLIQRKLSSASFDYFCENYLPAIPDKFFNAAVILIAKNVPEIRGDIYARLYAPSLIPSRGNHIFHQIYENLQLPYLGTKRRVEGWQGGKTPGSAEAGLPQSEDMSHELSHWLQTKL